MDAAWLLVTEIPQCVNMVRGHKGWFTKREAGVTAAVASLTNNPCDVNIKAATVALTTLETKLADLEAGYSRLLALDPARAEQWDNEIDELGDRMNEAATLTRDAIADATRQAAAPPAQAPQPGAGIKIKDSLRPDTLSREFNPVMLHGWYTDFSLYYESSTMERASLREQHGHFCRCLDPTLAQMMREKMTDDTPIFKQPDLPGGVRPPPSCMEILEAEFLHHHPMMFRRMTMLDLHHQKAEPTRDFARRFNDAGDQCDLDNMTRHDFQIMCLIHNLKDETLKGKLRKIRAPTWQVVLEKCEDHDRSKMSYERTQNSHQDSRQVTSSSSSCLLYTSPSPRDLSTSRMPSSA